MRILIDNFVTQVSTQSLYIYHELKKNTNIETYFWPSKNISTYDIFDDTKPDLFISHCASVDYELASYLDDVGNNEVLIALSTSGVNAKKLTELEMEFKQDLKLKVFFFGSQNIKFSKSKNIVINDCIDDNILKNEYHHRMPLAYYIQNNNDLPSEEGPYHTISSVIKEADVNLDQMKLASIMGNYDKIVFPNLTEFEQSFFDALYRSPEVYYTGNLSEIDKQSEKIFGQSLNIKNKSVDFNAVRKVIAEKHLPKNRVKTLLSQLPINQNIFTEVSQ